MIFEKLLENNRQWVEEKLQTDTHYFENLAKGQSPEILMIGCSDSRVSLEKILGADLGEIFIHRNIANQVNITDMNFLSVLDYAVNRLKVKHIIIFGHYDCGGVKAAIHGDNNSLTENWVMPIRDLYLQNKKDLDSEKDIYNQMAELNVIEQARNIFKTSIMQSAIKEKRAPMIHAWIFDIFTGRIKEIDYRQH